MRFGIMKRGESGMYDWTYDEFYGDVSKYGIEDESNGADYNQYFVAYLKSAANKFLEKWKKDHNGKLYDHGWVGDAFADDIDWFSDFYKETYGQRPHLPVWFYVHPLGLPMTEDTVRLFCANPIENAVAMARYARESFA